MFWFLRFVFAFLLNLGVVRFFPSLKNHERDVIRLDEPLSFLALLDSQGRTLFRSRLGCVRIIRVLAVTTLQRHSSVNCRQADQRIITRSVEGGLELDSTINWFRLVVVKKSKH